MFVLGSGETEREDAIKEHKEDGRPLERRETGSKLRWSWRRRC